jgi:hypothetical protein
MWKRICRRRRSSRPNAYRNDGLANVGREREHPHLAHEVGAEAELEDARFDLVDCCAACLAAQRCEQTSSTSRASHS